MTKWSYGHKRRSDGKWCLQLGSFKGLPRLLLAILLDEALSIVLVPYADERVESKQIHVEANSLQNRFLN